MSLFARWADDLRRLRDEGRYRSLRLPAGHDFTSNDYLGYASRHLVVSPDALPVSGAANRDAGSRSNRRSAGLLETTDDEPSKTKTPSDRSSNSVVPRCAHLLSNVLAKVPSKSP